MNSGGSLDNTSQGSSGTLVAAARTSTCIVDGGEVSRSGTPAFNLPKTPIVGDIDGAAEQYCGIDDVATVHCWGDFNNGGSAEATVVGPFSSVAVGNDVACALDDRGYPACWGHDTIEFLGTLHAPSVALQMIVAQEVLACGLSSEGGLLDCWGAHNATGIDDYLGRSFVDLALSWSGGCGITSDGSLDCWGGHDWVKPPPIGRSPRVFGGYYHLCALDETGLATCWGGDSLSEELWNDPVLETTRFAEINLGNQHGCGVTLEGGVVCFGAVR